VDGGYADRQVICKHANTQSTPRKPTAISSLAQSPADFATGGFNSAAATKHRAWTACFPLFP